MAIIRFSLYLSKEPVQTDTFSSGENGTEGDHHAVLTLSSPPRLASPDKLFYFHCSLSQSGIPNSRDPDPFHPWGFSEAKRPRFPPSQRSLLSGPQLPAMLCCEISAEWGARSVSAGNVGSRSLYFLCSPLCRVCADSWVRTVMGVCVWWYFR